MFGGIFGFGIDRKFSFNHYLLFKLFPTGLWIVKVLVYKLYIAFQTRPDTQTLFLLDYI